MKQKLSVIAALAVSLAVAAVIGCQTYDFEPVKPLALGQTTQVTTISANPGKPYVMMLIDKSGSMNLPAVINANCYEPNDGGLCGIKQPGSAYPTCNSAVCQSRWNALTNAATAFLQQDMNNPDGGPGIQVGLTFFPQPANFNLCAPASSIAVPLPTAGDPVTLANNEQAAINAMAGIQEANPPGPTGTGGGTPTGDSINFLAGTAGFPSGKPDYILLMTDGLPNCNANSGLNYNTDPVACDCTLDNPYVNQQLYCSNNPVNACNDVAATSSKIQLAANSGVKTIVVGFGDQVSGTDATRTLQNMAVAGGFQRWCYPDGGDCAPSDVSCMRNFDAGSMLCPQQYFSATTQQQLTAVLESIGQIIGASCVVTLSQAPQNPSLISVVVTDNGVTTSYPYQPTGTPGAVWSFTPPTTLTFLDPLCSKIVNATDNITYVIKVANVIQ